MPAPIFSGRAVAEARQAIVRLLISQRIVGAKVIAGPDADGFVTVLFAGLFPQKALELTPDAIARIEAGGGTPHPEPET